MSLESWTQPAVKAVMFNVNNLNRWLGNRVTHHTKTGSDGIAYLPAERTNVVFPVREGVKLRIDEHCLPSESWDKFTLRLDTQVWFHFDKPVSLEEAVRHWPHWFLRLIGLLVGTRLELACVQVFKVDPYEPQTDLRGMEGTILGWHSKPSEKDNTT